MPKHSMVVSGASAGGMAIVQDPNEALIPALPENAIGKVEVDHVLPVGMIADICPGGLHADRIDLPGMRQCAVGAEERFMSNAQDVEKQAEIIRRALVAGWEFPEA